MNKSLKVTKPSKPIQGQAELSKTKQKQTKLGRVILVNASTCGNAI